MKSRAPVDAHSLLSDITTGTLTISSSTASNIINGATTFNQTSTFSVIPLCSVNANTGSQLVNFSTLNSQGFTTLSLVQSNSNVWTGTNSFNTSLPTSTLVPNSPYQLVNKIYTDTNFQLISNMNNYVNITSAQNIAGVKSFSSLPTCSVIP